MNKKTLEDLQLSGKKVLVRVDFNVPLDKDRNITDDNRIRAALPTIRYLLDQNAKVILMSHLGRPSGTGFEEAYSMAPVAKRLGELLNMEIKLAKDVIGESAKALVEDIKEGEIVLLENVVSIKKKPRMIPNLPKHLLHLERST
jgi:3-phosphoglycerate kinase